MAGTLLSETELQSQIEDGVRFYCYTEENAIIDLMGIQDKTDVTLIRHAYLRTTSRNKGIGGKLLNYLSELTEQPVLIGTWEDATWVINFYLKHDFNMASFGEKEALLRKYWAIPVRQIETSVILANHKWNDIKLPNKRQICGKSLSYKEKDKLKTSVSCNTPNT